MGAYDDILQGKPSAYDDILADPAYSKSKSMKQQDKDVLGGLVRGAGSIGATILSPFDAAARAMGIENSWIGRTDRREAMDEGLRMLGADPTATAYKGGKLASEVMGTGGAGRVIGQGVKAIPMLTKAVPALVPALESGGFALGQNAMSPLANAALRTGAGAVTGGAMAGLVNPEDAATGALLGGAMPGSFKAAGEAGKFVGEKVMRPTAHRLMRMAVKPTIEQYRKGSGKAGVDALLDYGISPTEKGVDKIRSLLDELNDDIANRIQASTAMVDKNDVVSYLSDPMRAAMGQVDPLTDVNAVKNVATNFMNHPALPNQTFPVQTAQELKRGTYRALKNKYGQLGSAEEEAQKALARGLKDQVAKAVPEVSVLNAEEKKLLDALTVAERRALMSMNNNPAGLSLLANNKTAALGFMADRSTEFKALLARMINRASKMPNIVEPAAQQMSSPLLRGLLTIGASQ